MIFNIRHELIYTYSDKVYLEPHTLRLTPKSDATQRVDSFDITIDPEPIGITKSVDFSGNDTYSLWFRGMHERLRIKTESRVETYRKNPYDYIIMDNRAAELPARYDEAYSEQLQPYREKNGDISDSLRTYIAKIMEKSGPETLSFLSELSLSIYNDFEHVARPDGVPLDPRETLFSKQGACRDFAVLFIKAAKALGLAARFVSGYKEDESIDGERQLHAWAEVYIPGGGWRGYDPTAGLLVDDSHVVLASGARSASASPVEGSYRGTGVSSDLKFQIDITSE